jgi:hypothetical protein
VRFPRSEAIWGGSRGRNGRGEGAAEFGKVGMNATRGEVWEWLMEGDEADASVGRMVRRGVWFGTWSDEGEAVSTMDPLSR